jgi:hypothetical protein
MAPPQNASVIVVFAIVGICIAMAIVKFWTRYECAATRGVIETEGFADVMGSSQMTSCPVGSKSFTDITGAINCCSGTINGNTCEGTVKCTFSGSLANKYPICRPATMMLEGPWIGTPRPVQKIDVLENGETVYMLYDGTYVKMVTTSGKAKYFVGTLNNFASNAWPTYNDAGTNYRLKAV